MIEQMWKNWYFLPSHDMIDFRRPGHIFYISPITIIMHQTCHDTIIITIYVQLITCVNGSGSMNDLKQLIEAQDISTMNIS